MMCKRWAFIFAVGVLFASNAGWAQETATPPAAEASIEAPNSDQSNLEDINADAEEGEASVSYYQMDAESIDKLFVVRDIEAPAVDTESDTFLQGFIKSLVDKQAAEQPKEQTAFQILGSEVAPGTSMRLSWEPSDDFMGIAAPTAVLVANGVKPGPTLCMAAAVHGDELNGIEIVREVFYSLDPTQLSGTVVGIPIVNLQGFRRSSRYLADRRDLNRYFPGRPAGSAASRIAYSFFEEVIRHCDVLVDLHTGSFGRTNLPQLRADLTNEEVVRLAEKMGNIVVLQSRGASGSLRRAAVEAGIPAVTLEAGEPHELQKPVIDQGVKSVKTLIHALEMAKTLSFWELRTAPVYYKSRWVRSVNGGILFSAVKLGQTIKSGDILGTVTDPITNVKTDIVSPYDGRVIGMALNQVMYPGYAAYHVGLQQPAQVVSESEMDMDDDLSEEGASPELVPLSDQEGFQADSAIDAISDSPAPDPRPEEPEDE